MPGFKSILYTKDLPGRKWELIEPLLYETEVIFGNSDYPCILEVPKGYVTDSYSIPFWLWPIVWPNDYEMHPAVLHDYLYECGGLLPNGLIYTKADADDILREAMKSVGLGWYRRNIRWLGVRVNWRGGNFKNGK